VGSSTSTDQQQQAEQPQSLLFKLSAVAPKDDATKPKYCSDCAKRHDDCIIS